jgi:hypothetical protein
MGVEELEVKTSTDKDLTVCEYERVVRGMIFECVCSRRLIYAGVDSLSLHNNATAPRESWFHPMGRSARGVSKSKSKLQCIISRRALRKRIVGNQEDESQKRLLRHKSNMYSSAFGILPKTLVLANSLSLDTYG